ncbi:MAG TPA: hypothetical protein VNX66_03580 [Candidatus Sulfotelmatobacter sp.]|nr:hypothetical protein [Candidatus Sulfotelmatobacter sp.]
MKKSRAPEQRKRLPAVRLREAVRRLSQEWEAAQGGSAEVK